MMPSGGWIRAIRQALAMTSRDLARRMGIRQGTLSDFERAEREGRITLRSLKRAAEAMDCELIYALVPRDSVEAIVRRQARRAALARLLPVERSMDLERQNVAAPAREAQVEHLAEEIVRRGRGLWSS